MDGDVAFDHSQFANDDSDTKNGFDFGCGSRRRTTVVITLRDSAYPHEHDQPCGAVAVRDRIMPSGQVV